MLSKYDFEKAQYYTRELVALAHQRWGDVALSPKTFTWDDGTVSVFVEHTACYRDSPSAGINVRLEFHEDGTWATSEPTIREVIEQPLGERCEKYRLSIDEISIYAE